MENRSFKRIRKSKSIDAKELLKIQGFNINKELKIVDLIKYYSNLGFQASHLANACNIIKKMKQDKCAIFLSITSNIISSGLREIIAQLVKENKINGIITSTGAIEEDVIKSNNKFLLGKFEMNDEEVKANKMNRIGNILVPDDYYVKFENFNMKFLEKLYKKKKSISPSQYAYELGLKLKDKNSYLYWAAKNNIPVFCPGIVDGAIGDHVYFFNKKKKEKFVFDVNLDIEIFYDMILQPDKIAGIIIGGGIAKHHLIGAAILRDGLDYAVYVSTGTEYDGSLSGAKPREAVSWNKLKNKNNSEFIEAEASLVFPILAYTLLYN